MDAMSSVLSYNDLDLAPVLSNDKEEKGDDDIDQEVGQGDDEGGKEHHRGGH